MSFLSRMQTSHKLLVSSFAFTLPIAVLLYFAVAGINYDIRFARFEKYGNAFQRPLETLLRRIPLHERQALLLAGGDSRASTEMDAVARSIDQAFEELLAVNQRVGQALEFTEEGLGKRDRSQLKPELVQARWRKLASAGANMPAGEIAEKHQRLVADIRGMIAHAGDTSNLILDPDLDSYYLMDMTLLALPQTQDRLAGIIAEGVALLRKPEITLDDRIRMTALASLLQESDLDRVLGSAATALNEDANFYGPNESLPKNLKPALASYESATRAFLDDIRQLASGDAAGLSPESFLAAGTKAREQSFALWNTTVDELDALLEIRIHNYQSKRLYSLLLTLAALLLSGLLVLAISRSITRPASVIQDYARRVAGGELDARLTGSFGGELKDLAGNIQHMVAELRNKLGFAQGIIAGVTMPCFLADPEGRLTYMNDMLPRFLGKSGAAADYLNQELSRFFDRDAEIARTIQSVLREQKYVTNHEYQGQTTTGERFFIKLDCAPIYDLEHQLLGAFAMMAVLTDVKLQEERLKETNELISHSVSRAEGISHEVDQAVEALRRQVGQANEGANRQRERMTETAASMEEMNASVLEVARNAGDAAQVADETRDVAQRGAEVVNSAVESIHRVRKLSSQLKDSMAALGGQVEGIGRIMNVITDIADQTNLLALNAAIEAARAGDAGRGFAVVADEVRKLAEKTMGATREVGESIKTIQDGAHQNVANVDLAAEAVAETAELAGRSGEALRQIVNLVMSTSDQVRGIATSAEQQSAASEEIARAVDEVSAISAETSEGMDQAADSMRELKEQTGRLLELIRSMDA